MEAQNDWLKTEIAKGFMLLSALNLKGRPAAKDLTAVAKVWYGLLNKQEWQPQRDTARFQTAFETIAATQTEWPNPADFMQHLPPVPVRLVPKLEQKHVTTEYGKAQIEILKRHFAGLKTKNAPCMNRDWIHGPRHRTVGECKRIYAARQKGKEND
ncbi:hypothetical protein EGS38_00070 [Neisseria chenwenguii]|nr:hypothetical protein EGS38_00070 [Neisseria chenwenguii]